MKSLLILGCGYVGSALAADALERGWRVRAVTRSPERLAGLASLGVEVFGGLVHEDAWHGFADTKTDFVVNCVGAFGGGLEGYRLSYIEGNRSLARWTRSVGFSGAAVYTSSVAVYPDAGGEWVDESAASPHSERAALLLESERIALEDVRAGRNVALRLGGLYGPGRHLFLDRLMAGAAIVPPAVDYPLNLLRLEDASGAILAAFEAEGLASGAYGVVDDEPVSKAALIAWLTGEVEAKGISLSEEEGVAMASSRRESGPPANRRISNAAFKRAAGLKPAYPNFREGYRGLVDGFPG